MKNRKEFQFSLRLYFILVFVGILLLSSLLSSFCSLLIFWLFPQVFSEIHELVFLSLCLLVLIGSFLMWLGSRHLTRPIEDLNRAVKQVAAGDFSISLARKSYPKDQAPYHNELDQLVKNFNQMVLDLKALEEYRQDFISNISHEIKTPVAALSGLSQLLQGDLAPDERQEFLQLLEQEAGRLSRLCEDVLELSRLERGQKARKMREIRLDEQLRQAVILLAEKHADHPHDFELNCQPISLVTDGDLTMQVWLNLLDNAIKYSPRANKIEVSCWQDKECISVEIRDYGRGMTESQLRRMYEQFYQAEGSHADKGYGLGLAIVQKILPLLGAEISCQSELGEGTTFQVFFPLKS